MILFGCSVSKTNKRTVRNQNDFISFNNPRIQYEGRIAEKPGEAAGLCWSGSTVRIRFEGREIKALLKDYNGQNYFNVIVDGSVVRKIRIDSSKRWYSIAENLSPGEHVVELFKRTQINKEYKRGPSWFYGFQINGGKILPAPALKKRKMEFYGNSITCGHAIEDTTGKDSGANIFENNYLSYAALTARHYHAQYSCIAVSGIGLMAGFRKAIMPEIYHLRNPFDTTDVWDFSRYTPDIVVVNLLQNDEAVIGQPQNEQFKKRFGSRAPTDDDIVNAYKDFIRQLRNRYPRASIVCVLGSMGITRKGSKWPGLVERAVDELGDRNIYAHFFKYKETPGHPRVKEQEVMAESLVHFIDGHIKW